VISRNYWQEALKMLPAADQEILSTWTGSQIDLLWHIAVATEKARSRAAEKDSKIHLGSRTVCLRDVADSIIKWINHFKTLVDLVMQYDPGHAAIPWVGFRFILQLITAEGENQALVLVGLEKVAFTINRCALYEAFSSELIGLAKNTFAVSLVKLYVEVLRFLVDCKNHLLRQSLCEFAPRTTVMGHRSREIKSPA
jgi:hypothetical protein